MVSITPINYLFFITLYLEKILKYKLKLLLNLYILSLLIFFLPQSDSYLMFKLDQITL